MRVNEPYPLHRQDTIRWIFNLITQTQKLCRGRPGNKKGICTVIFLPPATKLGQGYIFTGVCHSVNRGGGGVPQCMLGYTPPGSRHPPGADMPPQTGHVAPWSRHPWSRHPPPRPDTPPQEQTPPESRHPFPRPACWEIQSTRGRYTSYWNAILFFKSRISPHHP